MAAAGHLLLLLLLWKLLSCIFITAADLVCNNNKERPFPMDASDFLISPSARSSVPVEAWLLLDVPAALRAHGRPQLKL